MDCRDKPGNDKPRAILLLSSPKFVMPALVAGIHDHRRREQGHRQ
jgi:hypothetical protein